MNGSNFLAASGGQIPKEKTDNVVKEFLNSSEVTLNSLYICSASVIRGLSGSNHVR